MGVAIVVGGSAGIGQAAAIEIARRGAGVILTFRSHPEGAEETVRAIEAAGGTAVALPLEVGDTASFPDFTARVRSALTTTWQLDAADGLVINAGIGEMAALDAITDEHYERLHRVLLKGPLFLTQALAPLLVDGGAIVNTTSTSTHATGVTPGYSVYAAMKGGLVVLTRYLAKELSARGIRVNSVSPGPTRTRLGGDAFQRYPELIAPQAARTALGRIGEAGDVGAVIAYLLSAEARWITGQDIEASGGVRPVTGPTASGTTGRPRHHALGVVASEEGDRVTRLELFFDLAFVFAFTQLSRLMAHHHDILGVLQALVILALLWWSWTSYSWLANLTHADEGIVRIAMIVATAAMFVAGLVVLEANEDRPGGLYAPLVFVGAYLVARVTHSIVFIAASWKASPALRGPTLLTSALSVIPSGVLLTIGAVLGSWWQVWLGVAAVALEPLIAHRTSAGVDWPVRSVAHFTERHGLIIILALGESIIAVGVGVADEPMSGPILGGALLAMAITVCLWWAYFSELAGSAEDALARRHEASRGHVATEGYTYIHLVLVGGIVLAALGLEEAMAQVADGTAFGIFGAAALGGGTACYLLGTGLFSRRVIGDWRVTRFVGATLLLGSTAVLAAVTPILAMSIVAGILALLLAIERWWGWAQGRRGKNSRKASPPTHVAPGRSGVPASRYPTSGVAQSLPISLRGRRSRILREGSAR